MLKSDMCRLPAEVLLGLESGAEDDMDSRSAHHDHDHHDHHHDEFESFVVHVPPAVSLADAKARVAAAVAVPGVLRVKGHMWVAAKPAPVVVQAMGPRVEAWFAPAAEEKPGLVVIGLKGINKARIEAVLEAEPVE
ncbi:GTP-binding protein [Breoghania sp.]|uniref:GTP-binding protein n=1 Tax=Breoghania sp. TaxID=2065378 RepID=UPI003204B54E